MALVNYLQQVGCYRQTSGEKLVRLEAHFAFKGIWRGYFSLVLSFTTSSSENGVRQMPAKYIPRVCPSYEQCLDEELAVEDVGRGIEGRARNGLVNLVGRGNRVSDRKYQHGACFGNASASVTYDASRATTA
jgi:hypothetical protein